MGSTARAQIGIVGCGCGGLFAAKEALHVTVRGGFRDRGIYSHAFFRRSSRLITRATLPAQREPEA